MKLKVHRGTKEIGGTCIEIESGGFHLVLDYGLPLVDAEESPFKLPEVNTRDALLDTGILHNISGLYEQTTKKTTLLISHAHPDHQGLIRYVDPSVPVYMTRGTAELMRASALFVDGPYAPSEYNEIVPFKPFVVGPFKVFPYLVDHSAPDAVAFLLEAEGKRVFYTGDFRATGRKRILFETLLKRSPKDIDLLITEGTMMSRSHELAQTEDELQKELTTRLRESEKLVYVFGSGQNLDRFVTVYKAAKDLKRTLVIDLYIAWILNQLKSNHNNIPQPGWPFLKVKHWTYHINRLKMAGESDFFLRLGKQKVDVKEIAENPSKFVFYSSANTLYQEILKKMPDLDAVDFYWSMWKGYLDRDEKVKPYATQHGIPIAHLHTSGHATREHLNQLIGTLSPKRLLPVHTFSPEKFVELHDNVIALKDGELVEL